MRLRNFRTLLLGADALLSGCGTIPPKADVYVNYPKAEAFAVAYANGGTDLVPWAKAPAGLVCRPADQEAAMIKYTRSKE